MRLAQLLAEEGDWLESRRHFLLACERCPTSTAWLGVGVASLRLGELQEVNCKRKTRNYYRHLLYRAPSVHKSFCLYYFRPRMPLQRQTCSTPRTPPCGLTCLCCASRQNENRRPSRVSSSPSNSTYKMMTSSPKFASCNNKLASETQATDIFIHILYFCTLINIFLSSTLKQVFFRFAGLFVSTNRLFTCPSSSQLEVAQWRGE